MDSEQRIRMKTRMVLDRELKIGVSENLRGTWILTHKGSKGI